MPLNIEQASNILEAGLKYVNAQDALHVLIDEYNDGDLNAFDEDIIDVVEKFLEARLQFEAIVESRGIVTTTT